MYRYIATLNRVIDGDTISVDVQLGFFIQQTMKLRLAGIDTPELRGEYKQAGLEAKRFVEAELASAHVICIETYKLGKYGRYVAEVYYSKRKIKATSIFKKKYSLNQALLANNMAKPIE